MIGLLNGFKESISSPFLGCVQGIAVDNVYDEYVRYKAIDKIQKDNIEYYCSNDYDLSILLDCPSVKYISVSGEADLSVLEKLENLVGIEIGGLYGENERYDFSKLQTLKFLSINGPGKNGSFFRNAALEKLCLTDYPQTDLTAFCDVARLKELEINLSRKLHSLHGVENASRLERLTVSYCPKLTDVSAVIFLNELKEISIEHCLKIDNLAVLEKNKKLKSLKLIDCAKRDFTEELCFLKNIENLELIEIMGEAGVIKTLEFLSKMKNLKSFSTNYKIKAKDRSLLSLLDEIKISEQ